MAIAYPLFYNSIEGDRIYNADSFSDWLKKFFTTGVFAGDFGITTNGMYATIGGGYANIEGKVMIFDDTTLTISVADSQYARIDNIVVERNDGDRQFYLKVVKGSPSASPVAPAVVRSGGVYQLVLYRIRVPAGSTSILAANITDTRPDPNLCGIVTGTVDEMDFSQFSAQFEAYFEDFVSGNQEEFEDWFERIKGALDTDAAGHLQNEINSIIESPDFPVDPSAESGTDDATIYDAGYNYFGWTDVFGTGVAKIKELFVHTVSKLKELEETKVVCVPGFKAFTIPKTESDDTFLTFDMAEYYDTAHYSLWNAECVIGVNKLPYYNNSGVLRISTVSGSVVKLGNTAQTMMNVTMYFTLYLRRKS